MDGYIKEKILKSKKIDKGKERRQHYWIAVKLEM